MHQVTTLDGMSAVLCIGDFTRGKVEITDLDLILETEPGDVYFFLGGELKHAVYPPEGPEDLDWARYSWIIFTHGILGCYLVLHDLATMFFGSDRASSHPHWLHKTPGSKVNPASLSTRLSALAEATASPFDYNWNAQSNKPASRRHDGKGCEGLF